MRPNYKEGRISFYFICLLSEVRLQKFAARWVAQTTDSFLLNLTHTLACEVKLLAKGFKVIAEEDNPIGEGFEMNDYIMEYKVMWY